MSAALFVQHLCTTNDVNGNPRRLYVTYNERGHIVDVQDEGYGNRPAVLRDGTATELPSIAVTPAEYREWLDREENLRGRFAVVEPAHADAAYVDREGTQPAEVPEFVWHRFYTRARAQAFRREHYKREVLTIVEFPREDQGRTDQ